MEIPAKTQTEPAQTEPSSLDNTRLSGVAFAFFLIFAAIWLLHLSLFRLPFFWDEAGYYIPAARDLWLTGSLIPHSTPSNAHPPLVMAWLALCWTLAGFSPLVTRTAMLAISAFALTGIYRLTRHVANAQVAIASVICVALYPVFFAQSSLAQVDMAAAAFTFWALYAYVSKRYARLAFWFSLAVLSKETAIIGPLALLALEVARAAMPDDMVRERRAHFNPRMLISLAFPGIPLALWYAYHYEKTGFIFGNPEFFRYNVASTTHPLRILLAFLMRLWQSFGYLNLIVLTALATLSMTLKPRPLAKGDTTTRKRICFATQFSWLAVVAAYVVALSVIGGAVLARYMLPVVPLVVIVCVSTLYRRLPGWKLAVGIVVLGFVAALFINPPYGFSPEDNLAYRDFIQLHQGAEDFLARHYPHARVLTAWPATDELTRPFLGYVTSPIQVVTIEDFTIEELMSANDRRDLFDVAFVFSTKYDPPHGWFANWQAWQALKIRFFGYHRDLPPEAAAQILGGRLVYSAWHKGQWVGIIEVGRVEQAKTSCPRALTAALQ